MNKEELLLLKQKLSQLSDLEKKERDLYLRKIALGEIQGPSTGFASIDKPWLKYIDEQDLKADFPLMSMKNYLLESNKDNYDRIAINYYGRKISYGELFGKIEEVKKSFYSLGIKEGDVVSIASPFIPEVVYAIYALNSLGVIVNLIDPRVPSERFLGYIMDTNTKYLIAFNAYYNKIREIEKQSNLEKTILISPVDSLPLGMKILGTIKESIKKNNIADKNKYTKWQEFMEYGKNIEYVDECTYKKDMPAIIVYTSGTSGEPKGALSSNESFNNLACNQRLLLDSTKVGDKFLLIMPPFIAYGLAIGLHGQLCKGQELIMYPAFNIDNQREMLGNLVMKYKPQAIMGVPTFMVDMIKHNKVQNADLSFLKTVIVGGDGMIPESEKLVNKFLEAKKSEARICKGWGLTEVNSAFTYTIKNECNQIGNVGIPLIGNNIKIVKPTMEDEKVDFDNLKELQYNEQGEIYINSNSSIIDYLNNEKESKEVFFTSKIDNEKWIRTKDLGRITEDGLLYIDGRMKRIIIRADGHNISPFAIENIINSDYRVVSCAVVAKPSDYEHGSDAVAYIKINDQYKNEEEDIIAELRRNVESKLPMRDVASEYKVIDEMPLTNIGKVDFKYLESQELQLSLKKK